MPGRSGWSSGVSDGGTPPLPSPAGFAERRAAARTVAAASTDLGDLRELLEMLGLDALDRDALDPDASDPDAPDPGGREPDEPRQRPTPLDPSVRRTAAGAPGRGATGTRRRHGMG